MDTSFPARERSETHSEHARQSSPTDYNLSLEMMESEESNYIPVADQPSWHLWGMMVGFMAAGAAILTILSIKSA